MEALSKVNRNYFMGIAILLVILHHLCLRCEGAWHEDSFPFNLFYWGQIGVDMFLFVSAYGCCASWEKNSWWRYMLHRMKRIYPQYCVFLLIVLVWFYADSSILHRLKIAAFSLMGIAPISRLGVYLEWYIPSLLMMYAILPIVYVAIKKVNGIWGICVLSLVILLSPWLLEKNWIYYAFQARLPVILCGIIAYVHRDDMTHLAKVFAFAMLLTLTTREEMMIHSMTIPLLFVALSMIQLKRPLNKMLSFFGKHSMEIFLAQTITTQFVMQAYYWGNKWFSLLIIIGLTVGLGLLFWVVQYGFDALFNKQISNSN